MCVRSGEAGRALRHREEGRHQDHQPREAQRVGAHEGTAHLPRVCTGCTACTVYVTVEVCLFTMCRWSGR